MDSMQLPLRMVPERLMGSIKREEGEAPVSGYPPSVQRPLAVPFGGVAGVERNAQYGFGFRIALKRKDGRQNRNRTRFAPASRAQGGARRLCEPAYPIRNR